MTMYYIDNLDTTFHFIGLSETITWATDNNKDLLSIQGYSHEQCIREGEALVSIFIIKYSIQLGMIWLFATKFSSLFLLRWINRFSTLIEM